MVAMAEGLTGGCGDFGDGSGCVYMCNWLEKHLFYEGLMSWIEIYFFFFLPSRRWPKGE